MARPYIWKWTARIKRDSLSLLQELAGELGFIIDTPGGYHGEPSAPAMLDALAAAYRRDPGGVKLAFKVMGITPSGEPTFSSGPAAESTSE